MLFPLHAKSYRAARRLQFQFFEQSVVSHATPMIALPHSTGTLATQPTSSYSGSGPVSSSPEHRERRFTPWDARAKRRRTQVALHGPGTLFADRHHATARPELKPRWSLVWIARTALKASRSWRRLAGSRALGSR